MRSSLLVVDEFPHSKQSTNACDIILNHRIANFASTENSQGYSENYSFFAGLLLESTSFERRERLLGESYLCKCAEILLALSNFCYSRFRGVCLIVVTKNAKDNVLIQLLFGVFSHSTEASYHHRAMVKYFVLVVVLAAVITSSERLLNHRRGFLRIFLFFVFFSSGSALKCYSCMSSGEESCKEDETKV